MTFRVKEAHCCLGAAPPRVIWRRDTTVSLDFIKIIRTFKYFVYVEENIRLIING